MTDVTLPAGWSPYALAVVHDGGLWATILSPPGLARVDAADPELIALDAAPMLVLPVGSALWVSRQDDKLARWDGRWSTVDLPAGSAPYGLAAAGDTIWFTLAGTNQLGRLADGRVELFDLPVEKAGPAMITVTGDGTVWAALNAAGALARWRDGELTVVPLPQAHAPAAPVGIAAAGDDVWYADIGGGAVGRVSPDGSVHLVPFDDPGCRPHAVAADPDGGCWVTLWAASKLARVTDDGVVREFPLPGEEPHGLAVTGDRVWVAMESGTVAGVDRHERP